jgi:hypothetical protein
MICIKADIPKEICAIDDKLKAIYHSKDSICIWLFKTQKEINSFTYDFIFLKKSYKYSLKLTQLQ